MIDFNRLDQVRQRRPLIHCVSNIVTANDCANLALAVGASPMMAQAPQEMGDITAASDATVLNTGTPDEIKFEVCAQCGKAATAAQTPVVLDPVGVGASPWRLRRVQELLHLFTPSILRVNLGEALALSAAGGREQGVDSPAPAPMTTASASSSARRRRAICTEKPLVDRFVEILENIENHLYFTARLHLIAPHGLHGDLRRALVWKMEHTGRNAAERDASHTVFLRKFQTGSVT